MVISFAKLFTSIGSAGFSGSSLGSSGNFDGGAYGTGLGSPYNPSPINLFLPYRRVEIPDGGLCFEKPYIPIQQRREALRLQLREEETSLRVKYESSLRIKDIELKQSFECDYERKTSLLNIILKRRRE